MGCLSKSTLRLDTGDTRSLWSDSVNKRNRDMESTKYDLKLGARLDLSKFYRQVETSRVARRTTQSCTCVNTAKEEGYLVTCKDWNHAQMVGRTNEVNANVGSENEVNVIERKIICAASRNKALWKYLIARIYSDSADATVLQWLCQKLWQLWVTAIENGADVNNLGTKSNGNWKRSWCQ